MKRKVAVISAILESPKEAQAEFNKIVSDFKGIVKGRMGIPYDEMGISVISIIIFGTIDEINSFTGKIGNVKGVIVKTSISKKEI
ncbi:iron-only hydrogenase system regulator [Sedimentibacter sp. zth1]|uniref:TM1266 family iron-only hydrogenase system putative regulator n=1 Tax=Sedimentibacter sp. zth1 TaxID=2816908 RepID=UPI001A90CDDF|nr:TM1266 family iron-only hydrogenase system putative regulator [Sedimentibacter sp. zth1]QSX06306.1 iron-only hydrogenase system regulator [Sedimentibacter sp. zth1]